MLETPDRHRHGCVVSSSRSLPDLLQGPRQIRCAPPQQRPCPAPRSFRILPNACPDICSTAATSSSNPTARSRESISTYAWVSKRWRSVLRSSRPRKCRRSLSSVKRARRSIPRDITWYHPSAMYTRSGHAMTPQHGIRFGKRNRNVK